MSTVPLCSLLLCAHCSSVLTVPLCPLLLCDHCSFVPNGPMYQLSISIILHFFSQDGKNMIDGRAESLNLLFIGAFISVANMVLLLIKRFIHS